MYFSLKLDFPWSSLDFRDTSAVANWNQILKQLAALFLVCVDYWAVFWKSKMSVRYRSHHLNGPNSHCVPFRSRSFILYHKYSTCTHTQKKSMTLGASKAIQLAPNQFWSTPNKSSVFNWSQENDLCCVGGGNGATNDSLDVRCGERDVWLSSQSGCLLECRVVIVL